MEDRNVHYPSDKEIEEYDELDERVTDEYENAYEEFYEPSEKTYQEELEKIVKRR